MNATSIIIILAAAALVIYALRGTVLKARGKSKSSCCGTPEAKAHKVDDTDEAHYPFTYDLTIGGMACSNCARAVENALNGTDGVWARVDLGKKRAHVLTKQPMEEDDFRQMLSLTDYEIVGYM